MANRYIPPRPSFDGGGSVPYRGNTIAQLLLAQGQQQAESEYARGDILGSTIAGVGQQIGEGIRAHQEQKQASKRAQAFNDLFSGTEPPDPNSIIRVLGPKDGMDVIKGLNALHPQTTYKDRAERLRDAARGVLAVPEEARPRAYEAAIGALKKSGELRQDEAPDKYDPNLVMQAANYGVAPAAPKETTPHVVAGALVDNSGKVLYEGKPKPADLQEVDLNVGGKKVKGTFDKTAGTYSYQGKVITDPQSWVEPKRTADKLVKVEHDDGTGHTVVEWLPQSEVRGQKFTKGLGATDQNRANMAETVNRTGQDIISKLSDPKFAAVVGPIMGRYGNLREFIGNPPPELAELAGEIESYSLASMGVHGMRNVKGAEKIASMMNGKHTPESIISAIKGLNSFSADYLKTVGRTPGTGQSGAPKKGDKKTFPNGRVGVFDGQGWVAQ